MTKDDLSENWNVNAFFWILVEEAAETVLEKEIREWSGNTIGSDFEAELVD